MEEIEKARIMLRIKMMQEVKNKIPMEERILFKALTKEQQILFLERYKHEVEGKLDKLRKNMDTAESKQKL